MNADRAPTTRFSRTPSTVSLGRVANITTVIQQKTEMEIIMRRNKSPLDKVIIAIALLGMLAPAISGGAKTESIQLPTKIVIANETQSLEIVKSEFNPNGRLIRVAIKNVSKKNIDWFRLSLGAALDVEADFAFSDKPLLAPGEIYEDEYPFDSKSNEVRITVVSLLFVDKASEGDAHYAQLSRDKRMGQRMELSRIVPLLQEASNASRSQHSNLLLKNLVSHSIGIIKS